MNRLLIAFLALLGVVAQAQPVAARGLDGAEVGVVAGQAAVIKAATAAHTEMAEAPVRPADTGGAFASVPSPRPGFAPATRAVLVGIDRAAE